MSQLRDFQGLRVSAGVDEAYRRFVEAFGRVDLAAAIGGALAAIAPVDRFYVYDQSPDFRVPPILIAARYEPWLGDGIERWSSQFRFADPVRDALKAARQPGAMAILRVGPGDIAERDYRVPFFDEPRIVERVSIVQRHARRWLVLHAARRCATGAFDEHDVDELAGLSQLLLPLAARQWELQAHAAPESRPETTDLDRRFALLYPEMSRREREVCTRAVLGMTTEATALDLGIGRASVHTYRRRAYKRLGISSSYELARLILH